VGAIETSVFLEVETFEPIGYRFLCFLGYVFIMLYLMPLVTVPAEIPFAKPDPSKMTIGVGNQFGFLRCLFGFVIGMMLYYGYKEDWQKTVLSNGYLLSALILGFFLSCHLGLPDVISICFFPFILLSVAYGSSGANAFLNLKPLQKIGDWSFSIYLIHQPLMLICFNVFAYIRSAKVDAPPPKVEIWFGWLIGLGVVAVTLIVSSLTYRFWEVPTRRWLNPNYKSQ
jgi:peptidoglycan/LPS O-acetylase OafA/YrhL